MGQQREGSSAQWIAIFVGLTWVVELANTFMDHRLNVWGLLPRTLHGLVGIPLSPFLHVGFGHLLLNTVPLIVLGGFVALQGRRVYLEVTAQNDGAIRLYRRLGFTMVKTVFKAVETVYA